MEQNDGCDKMLQFRVNNRIYKISNKRYVRKIRLLKQQSKNIIFPESD